MQIDIVKLKLPFTDPDVLYAYLVDDKIVVDGGFCSVEHAKVIEDLCDRVLVTHHHIDHVGVVFFSKIKAYIHPLEKEFVDMYTTPDKFTEFYSKICRDFMIPLEYIEPLKAIDILKLKVKAEIRSADEIEDFKIIHVPGHTPGHVCLLADNCLFSGDAIMSKTTPNVGYYPKFNIMKKYLNALHRLLKMDIEVIYPAHERPIYDVEDCILDLIEHYEERIQNVYESVDIEPKTVPEIAENVKWSSGRFDKLDRFNKFLALSETLSCLEYLESEGKVKRINGKFVKVL